MSVNEFPRFSTIIVLNDNFRDYSNLDVVASRADYDHYKASLGLEEPDLYKYPACRMFRPTPTDHSVCHTFNGHDLSKILKPSNWRSEYIDKESDFVFCKIKY